MNIYILLDRSGSMQTAWDETLGSINGYVKELTVSTNIVLAAFDSNEYNVIRNTNAKNWTDVSRDDVTPRGGTPLFDASARMMWRILDDNAEKAIFLVLTDGEENQSNHFKQTDVKALVAQLDNKKYETIFLGANFDKVGDVASAYNRSASKFANMTTGNMGEFMSKGLSAATARYDSGTAGGLNFTADEKQMAEKKKK